MANTKVKAEQLDLSDAVDIGIGIATPAAELHVNSTGENINLRLTRDTNNGIILTGTDGTNPAFRVSTIASGTATERLVLNPTGLYPYTDAGLELGDSNNRWNRLEVKSTTSGNISFVGEKTSAAGSYRTVEVYTTLSGSDATGQDVANYGIYNQIDSSATGGDTSDEHRVYGMRNIVKVTGDSDVVYGSYSQAEAEHSSGQVTLLYGSYNYAQADPNSGGTIANMYGAYNYAQSQGASGSTVTNIYGGYNKLLTAGGDDIGHTSLTACYAEIENDDSGQVNTTTTGYIYRGVYDDDSGNNAQYTNFYGLHLGASSLNGNMTGSGQSAGVYLDMPGLDAGFWNSEDQLNYFRGSLAIGSGSKNVANTVGMELHLVEPQGGDMIFARNDSATTTNEVLGRIYFGCTENSGSTVNYNTSIEAYAGGPQSASDSEGYLVFKTTPNNSTTLTERMRITSGGLWFLGKTASSLANTGVEIHPTGIMYATSTDNPQCYLNRENSHGVQLQGRKDNSNVWNITSDGSHYNNSDRNSKKDIADLTLGLNFIKQLKPKTFRYKIDAETDSLKTGLIAQDLEQSLTDAGVEKNSMTLIQHEPKEDESESQYMVDYSKLIPVLIKGMQEQQTVIETLQAEVAALKGG